MATDYEAGLAGLVKLIEWARSNTPEAARNEATTRLHLVDELLFECLGWNREDCVAEERHAGRYTDYSLGRPARKLVVEAKKEGTYFELPAGFERRTCKLHTITDGNVEFAEAIDQALDYCLRRGIPVGAVCNGNQLVAFLASRQDGVPPLDGRALVFTSLEDMRAQFPLLWRNLSRAGIAAYNIYSALRGEAVQPPPDKLSQRLAGYPGFKNRNQLQAELDLLGELFIEDVINAPEIEEDFLRECYCPSGALSQYALVSRQILETRYSALFQKEAKVPTLEPVRNKAGVSTELTGDIIAASVSRRPIILLGDVGVGKTIFIRHLMSIEARDIFEKAVALYIDFGKEPALAQDLSSFVLDRCGKQLLNDYKIDIEERNFVRGVYHFDLKRFEKSAYADLKQVDAAAFVQKEVEFLDGKVRNQGAHLRNCLKHIAGAQKRQIVIFLDNVDQRPFEFQEQVFLIGHSLAETWPGTVFISLRPDTFFQSRRKGSLTAYQPRVFTVAPPRVDAVISRRLGFVLRQLATTGILASYSSSLELHSATLVKYLNVLVESFERNKELMELIDNLSGGNIRQALSFITAFVGSGHVDSHKILGEVEESGRYIIPLHEFMRAVIYGDAEHYDPSASPIANLFDISQPDGREHFLLGIILAHVERLGAMGAQEGFVETEKIYQFCQDLGFQPSQVQFAVQRAFEKRLIEPSLRLSDPALVGSYRISTVGSYTARNLAHHFSYLDAMVVDTPILDESVRPRIYNAYSISERLNRAEIFCSYLDTQWGSLEGKGLAFDWAEASSALKNEIRRIRSRVP